MSTAFVVGNGTSRKPISLESLKQYGPIYACNAVYRDFRPDYLIAVDAKMVMEICKTGWQKHNKVYTNHNKQLNDIQGLNILNPSKGWSSGPTALDLASDHGHGPIYLLGFDFKGTTGTGKGDDKVNNLYAGTFNYKREHDPATYFGNWERQVGIICQRNHTKRYIRVVAEGDKFLPGSLKNFTNLSHITIEDFQKIFG
tara:strand:+ start:8515 stop:9111 length:597 start_codon:yes stop_codon:yes gene_type:complete